MKWRRRLGDYFPPKGKAVKKVVTGTKVRLRGKRMSDARDGVQVLTGKVTG